jgi:alpha-L-fucosidase
MGTSFGYNRFEPESSYMTATEIVHTLVDVVARGGNLLLNVGPAADGSVPWTQAERLLAAGWWLRTNGAAIYGSRPWSRPEGATDDGVPVRVTVGAGGGVSVQLPDIPAASPAAALRFEPAP